MTKRLGLYLSLGFVGVVLLLAGLSWDALLHAGDPTLAAREGLFAWRNPGHVLLGLGLGTVVVGLVGAGCTAMAMSGTDSRWARPGTQRAFLAGSTALVVACTAVTSWSASSMHDGHGTGAATAPAGHADLAAAEPAGAHPHPEPAPAAGGAAPAVHGHDGAAVASPERPAAVDHHDATPAGRAVTRPAAAAHDHHPTSTGAVIPHPAVADPPHPPHPSHAAAGPEPGHPHGPPAGTPAPPPAPPEGGEVAPVRWGPFLLPPAGAGGDLDHSNVVLPEGPKPCSGCFVVGVQPDLVYADGTSANLDTGVMLHHAVFFQAGEKDTTCDGDEALGRLGQRFFASGNERTGGVLPAGFGYRLTDAPVNGLFHIMNHASEPKTVFFEMKVRWVPASTAGIRPVTPVWLDMNNCRTSEYDVPAGPSSSHWTWTSTLTGRIVSTGGHVHDGGIRTTLSNRTTGQRICTSWAGYGTKPAFRGSVESMSVCAWDALGGVRAGEVLDLETAYDAATPLDDAMGIMLAYVYETADLGAGTPPPPEVSGETPAPPASTPPPSGAHPHEH